MCESLAESDDLAARRTLIDTLDAAGVPELRRGIVVEACVAVAWPDPSSAAVHPQEEREALFGAWLEGIDALAAGRTQVWLVEDVHWAGGDVLAFLDRAVARGAAGPPGGRLIVATTRPSLLEANPDWSAELAENGRQLLQLSTLAPTDARSLVAALVGDALPDPLVERIAERSDGNPLFIEELLRTWVSVGTLVREDERWRLTVGADDIPLPTSVQSIYAAQLDDLPLDARNLARRASVAGRRFPVGALQPLGAAAEGGLGPLQRRQLVVGPVDEPVVGTAFSYRHALLRDAGYASLARAERARLHIRLARWLEGAAGERATELAEQMAGHYAAALESAPALTREVEGLEREALRRLAADWYERAGQGTLALSAHDAARQLFKRSIELTPDGDDLARARRWEKLGDATAFAADMDEGAAAYEKAIDLYRAAAGAAARATEAAARLAEARSGLARSTAALSDVRYQQLRFNDARDIANEALAEVGDEDRAAIARLLTARALGSLGASGPSPDIERDLERATELARGSAEPRVELKARSGLAMLRSESGRGTMADWQELSEMAQATGDWREAVGASTSAIMYLLDDRAVESFAPIERTRETAASHGLTEETGWLDYLAAEAAFVSGDWARAREVGGRAIEVGQANAYLRMTVRTWHVLIPIAGATGDRATLDEAARWYRSLEGKFEFPDSPYSRVIRVAQDLEMAAAGLWPELVPEVEPRIASYNDDPSGPSWSAALDRVFRAWLEAGDLDGAARAFAALDEAVARMGSVTNLGHGAHRLMAGRLALARGDRDAAASAGRAALEHFRASNAPWWMAKAMRLVERSGAADDEMLGQVREIEHKLGSAGPTA
jgi:tetratricopeptide (TPR) repeat protein